MVRNRQYSLDDSAVRRRFQRGVAKKRPDGRQTEVPASGAIVPAVFQIFQERPDQRGIQIAQPQLRRSFAQPFLGELQQQTERIAMGGDGVRAD
jgi:hypothetical protein